MSKYKYQIVPSGHMFFIERRKRFTRRWQVVTRISLPEGPEYREGQAKELATKAVTALKEIKEVDTIILGKS